VVLDLAGVEHPESYALGKSIVPVIRDPAKSVRSFTTFSYDDLMILPPSFPGGHIRGVREGDWIYAAYFGLDGSGLDYELYNIKSDPGQLDTLAYQRPARATYGWCAAVHGT
jgi:arylsulfatase A-like enzyme